MKKSNKLSALYVVSSLLLFLVLIGGGVYGVYVSVGLNFVGTNMSNITNAGNSNVSNVSLSENVVTGSSSMTGIIILSVALIVLAIFDLVSMIKQLVFFKQFNVIKNSSFEQVVERKVKSKKSVIVFAFIIDILSFCVGLAGLFLNAKSYVANNISWVLYLIDGAVCVFAVFSFVLLIVKLRKVKKQNNEMMIQKNNAIQNEEKVYENINGLKIENIDRLEYFLLKLKHLKTSRVITTEEYDKIRKSVLGSDDVEIEK